MIRHGILGRCRRQWTISACPPQPRQHSVNGGSHRHNSDRRRTPNPKSECLTGQNRVYPPTPNQRCVHIWDSDGAWPCLPTCPPTTRTTRQSPALKLPATALPRHCYGSAPMGSGPHGSTTVAVPSTRRNRPVAGPAVVPEVRGKPAQDDESSQVFPGIP